MKVKSETNAFEAALAAAAGDKLVEVWPENWQTVGLFISVATQWRIGMGGPTGLDYNVLFRILDNMGCSRDEWDQLFDDIRVMESAALESMRQQN